MYSLYSKMFQGLPVETFRDYNVRWLKSSTKDPQLIFPRYQMRRPSAEKAAGGEWKPSGLKILELLSRTEGGRVAEPRLVPAITPQDDGDGY